MQPPKTVLPGDNYYTIGNDGSFGMRGKSDNYATNMWDKRLVHFQHKPVFQNGFMRFTTTTPALFNPNFVESRTRMDVGDNGSFAWKTGYGRNWDRYADYLDNMNVNGFTLSGADGANPYEVSPETVAFLQAVRPAFKRGGFFPNAAKRKQMEEDARAAIAPKIAKLYEGQGTWAALTGYRDYNDRLQRDLNAMYQNAMYMLNSGDPKLKQQGETLMNIVARGQSVFNETQPKVTAQLQDKMNGVKNYARNNWWWLVPGAGLVLAGLGSLFGDGIAEAQNGTAQMTTRQPQTPIPDQWTTSLVQPNMNGMTA